MATLMEPSAGNDVVDDELLIAEIKRRLPRLSPRINTCGLLWLALARDPSLVPTRVCKAAAPTACLAWPPC